MILFQLEKSGASKFENLVVAQWALKKKAPIKPTHVAWQRIAAKVIPRLHHASKFIVTFPLFVFAFFIVSLFFTFYSELFIVGELDGIKACFFSKLPFSASIVF